MFTCLKVKRHEDEGDQKCFIKNGGVLLEEVIALRNGRSNPICHFSAKELMRATNNYDARQIFVQDLGYTLYKGSLRDRPILVKKYDSRWRFLETAPYKDIAFGSQMSVHKNVLKVIGCCLETELPITVYEFAGTKILSACISATNDEPLPWKCRLKIAIGIASAVAYLHTAFSRPVIHRDIKCSNILLDQNNVPKLIDFWLCISIPEGESHVIADLAAWRTVNLTPEYRNRGYLTEKVDVYQFGLLLIELSRGQDFVPFWREHNIRLRIEMYINAVRDRIRNEGIDQFQDFKTLILKCTSFEEEERPTMIEVVKELRLIDQSFTSPS
ncbi:non-functional pseudokinase ZED1-like [Herrania umbratica]|uniref:Non-functional pseudokinase ZED1-like n=1 Tax=Herrania umbratica TaxID=108875 RepID=A0A6J1A437_9ROSI|nr:non-functional pseudokinase ZED1-like [Herrania umbratica]